jgi:mono/diheme cytochrome c family protein
MAGANAPEQVGSCRWEKHHMSPRGVTREHAAASSGWRIVALLACGYVAMTLLVALMPSRSTDMGRASPAVAAGAGTWRTENCIACHAIYGLGGHIGPDLTNTVSRLGAEGVAAKVLAGGGTMPPFALSDDEVAELIAWLSYIGETGVYPLPRHFSPGYGDIR